MEPRPTNQPRQVRIERCYTRTAPGSVLVETGGTRVLCTASIENRVPDFRVGSGGGWLTAEYNMLPHSTRPRKPRDRAGKVDGRNVEIQRLIGRSLRNVLRLDQLGERSIWVDCDVLDADGGTRTASITGAFVAVVDAVVRTTDLPHSSEIFTDSIAAISVGIRNGTVLLDLDYENDSQADVDMNLVMTGRGQFVEIQGTGERQSFSPDELAAMLELGRVGIHALTAAQRSALGSDWPFPTK